jgi:hypothetical protein
VKPRGRARQHSALARDERAQIRFPIVGFITLATISEAIERVIGERERLRERGS